MKDALLKYDENYRDKGFISLAGVDEAGRGPLAGPVVASAVIVRDFSFTSRVDDSKKMTARQREAAFGEIREKCWVGTGIVGPRLIDSLNILEATMLAMEKAVAALSKRPDCVLIDGNRLPQLGIRKFAVVNGDALSFSIACASVVAKVTRDELMREADKKYPLYGFAKHKGYGTKLHIERLREHGPCDIHRTSFEPVRLSWKRS